MTPEPRPPAPAPMTDAQHRALRALGRVKGLDAPALDREARAACGRPLAELDETQARTLIAHVQRI